MADVTRRGFLTQISIATGVGLAGGVGLHQVLLAPAQPRAPGVGSGLPTVTSALVSSGGLSLAGPMVVHVRDVATSEISLMVGTHELVYSDPELVARLVKSAASVGSAKG